MTLDDAQGIFEALLREGVDFVVIGAMAMAAQGLPRATQDLDFFVAPRLENLLALKRALRALFDDPNVEEIDPEELMGEYPAVNDIPPSGRFSLDILTRLGEAFSWEDVVASADRVDVGRLSIKVANPDLLYRMKKDTVRPQDRADALRISETFDLEDR